jgi:capsular polysaccharide biosynthesis protein
MIELDPEIDIHGQSLICTTAPSCIESENVIYTPNSKVWGGLYNFDGSLIENAGMYRGPEKHLVLPEVEINSKPPSNKRLGGRYIYIGPIHPHYGHFLLSTLSRFWHIGQHGLNGRKILFDSAGSIQSRYDQPYFSAIMHALGIGPDDFHYQPENTWVDDVLVPQPSFTELLKAHSQFAELARSIASKLSAPEIQNSSKTTVYLSKSNLQSGVWRFTNEIEVENALRDRGVTIIYPEQLSFQEQIYIFNSGNKIISTMGSGIHTAVFSSTKPKMTILCRDDHIVSNFVLIDKLVGARSTYLKNNNEDLGEGDGFSANHKIIDPNNTADKLLELSSID